MDVVRARALLGVEPAATEERVRQAYRQALRAAHPDVSANADAAERTRSIVDAYRSITAGTPAGSADNTGASGSTADADGVDREDGSAAADPSDRVGTEAKSDSSDVWLAADDTIALACPGDEAFARLVETAHRFGDLTYVDRQTGFLESVIRMPDGGTVSVVISLQGRANGTTEAFVTMEPVDVPRSPLPPIRALTEEIVELLR